MSSEPPQFHENTLTPCQINEQSLRNALQSFESVIQRGVQLLITESPSPVSSLEDDTAYGSIFSGHIGVLSRVSCGVFDCFLSWEHQEAGQYTPPNIVPYYYLFTAVPGVELDYAHMADRPLRLGIAMSFLRLHYQLDDVFPRGHDSPDLLALAKLRIDHLPRTLNLNPGRPSPITSPALGALVMRVIAKQWLPDDPKTLLSAVEVAVLQARTIAFRDHAMGVDEVLYGRAGLLWAILEVWKHSPEQDTLSAFAPVFQVIHKLVAAILDAGRENADAYQEQIKDKSEPVDMPLMWCWFDEYNCLGAMHGAAGVLAILLDPALPRHSITLSKAYPDIARTITALCNICVANGGHLPMSLPPRQSSRKSPLVQVCHGGPGILILLAAAKRNTDFASQFWSPQWDNAIHATSDLIWEQGLLGKGLSLCHGIGGNALSLLLLANPSDDQTDGHLATALTMMSEAVEAPPFKPESTRYRMPDHPWSLFEGLAGLLCAWSEACVQIRLKLRVIELRRLGIAENNEITKDEGITRLMNRSLGFPCLVGSAVGGVQVSLAGSG